MLYAVIFMELRISENPGVHIFRDKLQILFKILLTVIKKLPVCNKESSTAKL